MVMRACNVRDSADPGDLGAQRRLNSARQMVIADQAPVVQVGGLARVLGGLWLPPGERGRLVPVIALDVWAIVGMCRIGMPVISGIT